MKNKLLILFSIFVLTPMLVIAQEAPLHRVVYLWDVTNSMHGGHLGNVSKKEVPVARKNMQIKDYNKDYDIYDLILETLLQHIEEYDENTEIIVIPFDEDINEKKDIWRSTATIEGKTFLKNQIKNYYNPSETYTNIHKALSRAKTFFDGSTLPQATESSVLYILTDGDHSGGKCLTRSKGNIPSNQEFYSLLYTWCDFAEKYNVKGYYFLLTDQAIKNNELRKILESGKSCFEVYNYYEKHFFNIRGNQNINIKEDYGKPIRLSIELEDVKKQITEPVQVRVYAEENPYFVLDENITVDGSATIEVTPKYRTSLYELQNILPTDTKTEVKIHFDQLDKQAKNQLRNNSCEWYFINKAQKILEITFK